MVATQDYTWEQGDDLIIEIIYKINDQPVDLVTEPGYAVRMDIAPSAGVGSSPAPIFSFNSEDFDGNGLDQEGVDDNEVVFPAETGAIHIVIPRSLTLPGGVVAEALSTTNTFAYDLFLRDKGLNKQKKLLQGKITVNRSITKWV